MIRSSLKSGGVDIENATLSGGSDQAGGMTITCSVGDIIIVGTDRGSATITNVTGATLLNDNNGNNRCKAYVATATSVRADFSEGTYCYNVVIHP